MAIVSSPSAFFSYASKILGCCKFGLLFVGVPRIVEASVDGVSLSA